MSLLDEKITALFRRGSPIFNSAESTPFVDRPIAEKAASETVVSEPAVEEENAARVYDQPTPASQGMAEQTNSPWARLDLDTAIRLRWALRDIKAKRTKLTPVSPSDLKTSRRNKGAGISPVKSMI